LRLREAAPVVPAPHRVASALLEQAAADAGAQHPLAHLGLHLGHRGRSQPGDWVKHHPRRRVRGGGRRNDPIEDAAVEMHVRVQRRTEAVGLGRRKPPRSRGRTPRTEPWPNHNGGCRIRDGGEKPVRHRPAAPSRPSRPRAPARSRSAPGRCDTTSCVRDGGADSSGCRRAPVGLRQTWEHPSKRGDRLGEGQRCAAASRARRTLATAPTRAGGVHGRHASPRSSGPHRHRSCPAMSIPCDSPFASSRSI